MKVIFAVDAIFPPLTGIGRYAWELASRLAANARIDDLRLLAMAGWASDLASLTGGLWPAPAVTPSRFANGAVLGLRKKLSGQIWAVQGYSLLMQTWRRHLLRHFDDHLYHSPNFFLPDFPGRSIATVHDLSIYRFPESHPDARRKLFDLEMSRTLRRADHILVDSEFARREVIDYFGWPNTKVTAVHLGVSAAFHPRTEPEARPVLGRYGLGWKRYALCVSTVEPRKKIIELLDAYEVLPDRLRQDFPLVLAGAPGWLNDDILARLERGGRSGWVRHLGFVPDADLPSLYAGAHAFCYPSIYEGYGLPVLEAMASGVPILAANRSSLPEVADGAAWLVDPEDHDAMREGLRNLLENDTWRASATRLGVEIARRATWDRCAERTIAVYADVLDS